MVATTMMGLEEILADELRKLGAQNVNILNRAVEFVGDIGFMYKANLNLRTAIRILKPIFEFLLDIKARLGRVRQAVASIMSLGNKFFSLSHILSSFGSRVKGPQAGSQFVW